MSPWQEADAHVGRVRADWKPPAVPRHRHAVEAQLELSGDRRLEVLEVGPRREQCPRLARQDARALQDGGSGACCDDRHASVETLAGACDDGDAVAPRLHMAHDYAEL